MSFDYYLTVPSEKWPNFDQLQMALDQDGFGVGVSLPDGLLTSHAFSISEANQSFVLSFRGMEAQVGGWLTTFNEGDFKIMEDSWEPYRAHAVVDMMIKGDLSIKIGDRLCHVSYWDSDVALGVWWHVCATFVKHFGATYIDPQGDGVLDYETLIATADGFCANNDIKHAPNS